MITSNRHLLYVATAAIVAVMSMLMLLNAQEASAHTITITVPTPFAFLDGSADDHDGVVNGVFLVNDGDIVIAAGGSITCNDPPAPPNASACPIILTGSAGNFIMQCGSGVFAENNLSGGFGGSITVNASANVTLDGPCPVNGGPVISGSRAGGGSGLAGDITITAGGNFSMDCGSMILAENTGAQGAGDISITAGGDLTLKAGCGIGAGPLISSSKTGAMDSFDAGKISLIANGPNSDILIGAGTAADWNERSDDGQVIADSKNDSGDIYIKATKTVTIDGLVSSGYDYSGSTTTSRGGTITIIAGCTVTITGKVSSKGQDPGADLVHIEGCDVYIYGLVESTAEGHQPGNPPGSNPRECYDADGNGPNLPTRPDKPANSTVCLEIWAGGTLVVSNQNGNHGEVNTDVGNGNGTEGHGWADLYARLDVTINGGTLPGEKYAVHSNGFGGSGGGGEMGGLVTIMSTTGKVSMTGLAVAAWAGSQGSNSDGGTANISAALNVDLDASTTDVGARDLLGFINIRSYSGQVTGGAQGLLDSCGDNLAPTADVDNTCVGVGGVTLQGCGTVAPNDGVTFAGTADPATLASPDACAPAAPTPSSYVILPVCDCGTPTPTKTLEITQTPFGCPEDPDKAALITRTVGLSGDATSSPPNYPTLQLAYNAAAANTKEVIGMFSQTKENVTLNGTKTLTITQCTTAKITALDPSLPVWNITSSGKLTIIGPDSVGGTIGWRVQTNGHDLKAVRAEGASQYGILVLGNSNKISFNSVKTSGIAGIRVEGDSNTIKGGTVLNNAEGVLFTSTANSNTFSGANVVDNTSNGIDVQGTGNTITDNGRINDNGGHGILVTVGPNTIAKNKSESGKGNSGDGIHLNATAAGVAITDNTMLSNDGDGIFVAGANNTLKGNSASKNGGDGFDISGGAAGTPNKLRDNKSNDGGENTGAEYRLLNSVRNDSGGNKADGTTVPKTSAPTKCATFPATNVTGTFAAVNICE